MTSSTTQRWNDPAAIVGVGIYPHGRHPGRKASGEGLSRGEAAGAAA